MNIVASTKEFVHTLSNKLLPLHGRINLLQMQPDQVSAERLGDLERLTETMMTMVNDFRAELAEELQTQNKNKGSDPQKQALVHLTMCGYSELEFEAIQQHVSNLDSASGFLLYKDGFYLVHFDSVCCGEVMTNVFMSLQLKNIRILHHEPAASSSEKGWQFLSLDVLAMVPEINVLISGVGERLDWTSAHTQRVKDAISQG